MIRKLSLIASTGILAFVISVAGVAVHGQVVSVSGGAIQGTITDSSGAILPGANLTILNTDTQLTKTLTTDSAGFYSVGTLVPGPYRITVTMNGFSTLTVDTVIRTGTVTSGNFRLTVGSSTTTVEVNAGALQVNTEQAGVSDVINKEQIDSLPVNGRNFLDLAQIEPGVILQSGESFDPTKAGYSALSISGVSGRTTRILLDGQDVTDETVGTTIFNVSQGAIGDFQLNRATQDVSGDVTSTGQVLVSTNSGTNAFHGMAFYDFQDHSVGFARTVGGLDSPFQRNQFGGSVGGPILKDRLFFFANVERIKQESPKSIQMTSTFAAIQAKYPVIPSPYRQTYSTIRLDYSGPHAMHFFGRANYNVDLSSSNFGFGYEIYNNRDNTPGFAGGMDVATGRFTHSFRVSYEKFHNLLVDAVTGNSSVYNGFPGLNFRSLADGLYSGPNVDAPQNTYQSDKQFRYDGGWLKGRHNIRYGYSLNRILGGGFANFFGLAPRASISSATLFTGPTSTNPNALGCGGVAGAAACPGDPLNGYFTSGARLGNGEGFFTENPGFGLAGGGVEDWRQGVYIADTWKVTPSFTLTAGVRWSVDTDRANQDLPTPLCSDVTVTPSPCSGSTPLLSVIDPSLGARVHQPYANFGPQLGFAFSPGDHKTVIRAAFGIFYESNPFNNTTNLRGPMIKTGLFNDPNHVICGGTNSLALPDGTSINSDGGVPFATFCAQSLAKAAPHILSVQSTFQSVTTKVGPASNGSYIGNTLSTTGIYGAPFRTPYSEQWNGGIQRELRPGMVLSVDYVHNSTLKIAQPIDMNHVGAARFLNTTAANNAIKATLAGCKAASIQASLTPGGCANGSGPNKTATIVDYANNGLDSGNALLGGGSPYTLGATPATGAAFPGTNPAFGNIDAIMPTGRSGYDALQVVFKQQKTHPLPGVMSSNLQVSYSLSRIVSTVPFGNGGSGDQFFITQNGVYNNDNTTANMGRSSLDHTHQISFGGSATFKYGPQIGIIGHFFSAAPADLTLDPGGTSGTEVGGIYQSDVNGDGLLADLVPGTNPGYYMHEYKGGNLNKLISQYNATSAGHLTPAGQALINAGLFTSAQLTALQAVQQPILPVPGNQAIENSFYRNLDLSASYPIRFNKLREGLALIPSVSFYNIFNFSNFTNYQPAQGATLLANTTTGSTNGYLNGPNTFINHDQKRVQRGSGTSDIGGPRTTEFSLKLNF